MTEEMDKAVRERARHRCEYCHAPQAAYPERFQIDHIIARQHEGPTSLDNLALCCLECNRRKGPNVGSLDTPTGQLVPLFNPRMDNWNQHFVWNGPTLEGLTPVGRVTIRTLTINRAPRMLVRRTLIDEGIFPPPDDTVR